MGKKTVAASKTVNATVAKETAVEEKKPFDRNRDMTGVLFVNDKRETENHPNFTGRIIIGGKQYSLSAWEKESRDGKPYLSLAVREWVERPRVDDGDESSNLLA